MDRLPLVLSELRAQAERCLEEETPSAAQARELAASVLAALAALERAAEETRSLGRGGHPYREEARGEVAEARELALVASLERALDETRARLAAAERALAARS
jgi:hypothetical protein